MKIASTNITSAVTHRVVALGMKAHLQCLQEVCLPKRLIKGMIADAIEAGKSFIGGPVDPEHAKATAGVGFLAVKGLVLYPHPNPSKDYVDAEASGRCMIVCTDLGGCTLAIATVYGWTGAVKGSREAERTDDIFTIIQNEFEEMEPGPR